jgi:hypothetical protein
MNEWLRGERCERTVIGLRQLWPAECLPACRGLVGSGSGADAQEAGSSGEEVAACIEKH